MPMINLLDSSIYNRIAAGEVVERPASVIKELVENAMDAGASRITVSVSSGGRVNMTVTDDGCGISREDLKTAFLPHATSKIKSIEDLDHIATLGFRGEALASIAAVSMVTVKSRAEDSPEAWTLSVRGGEFSELSPCALDQGTVFSVDHLFFNAPARAKFLKSDRAEEGEITDLMQKFILSRPELSFTYILNGKTIYQSDGQDLYSAMYCVYGMDTLENCYSLEEQNSQGYRLSGYLGKPSFSKPNRTGQTLFVNGRSVTHPAISACISNAYAVYLMKRQYPFFVLSLTLPVDEVDVNVHPNKKEVRFENPQRVIGFVYHAVHQLLLNELEKKPFFPETQSSRAVDLSSLEKLGQPVLPKANREKFRVQFREEEDTPSKSVADLLPEAFRPVQIGDIRHPGEDTILKAEMNFPELCLADPGAETACASEEKPPMSFPSAGKDGETSYPDPFNNQKNTKNDTNSDIKTDLPEETINAQPGILPFLGERPKWRYVGTIFGTYLIAEREEMVCLIDQHAAHERLLYDRLCAAAKTRSTVRQHLMITFERRLDPREEELLAGERQEFENLGFELEFGKGCLKISAIPLDLVEMDLKAYFDEVLFDLFQGKKTSDRGVMQMLMQKACKAAVKGNRELSRSEVELLLNQLDQEGTVPLCPHGRPILISVTKRELEKKFKRIVD